MKTCQSRIVSFLAFVLTAIPMQSVFAQTFNGDLDLLTQADVDAFAYTEVTGNLYVWGSDIIDLSPLSGLTTVGGSLWIWQNTSLVEVYGFEALTTTGGGVYVNENPNLVIVDAFDALQSTGDNIEFYSNDSLVVVSGFGSLHTDGWSLEFSYNPVLVAIPEFASLTTIASSLFIFNNDLLSEITGFNALDYVDYSFNIFDNPELSDLCGFYNYFSANNPYTGGGIFSIENNHPDLPNPTVIQDILDAGPCAVSPVDRAAKVLQDLNQLLPTGNPKTDTRINKAIDSLNENMNPKYWVDANHLSSSGKKVFDNDKKAINELIKVEARPVEVDDVIVEILTIEEALARIALNDAIAGFGDQKKIAKAEEDMAKADEFMAGLNKILADNEKKLKALEEARKNAWINAFKSLFGG